MNTSTAPDEVRTRAFEALVHEHHQPVLAYALTLAREPADEELKRMVSFVKSQPRYKPTAEDEDEGNGRRKRGNRGRKMTREDTAHAAQSGSSRNVGG